MGLIQRKEVRKGKEKEKKAKEEKKRNKKENESAEKTENIEINEKIKVDNITEDPEAERIKKRLEELNKLKEFKGIYSRDLLEQLFLKAISDWEEAKKISERFENNSGMK
jgi:hypothetical protein